MTSLAILTFEITLTRIFSVTYSYHYSFLVVSFALFGLGVGGIFAYLFSSAFSNNVFSRLALTSSSYSLAVPLLTIMVAASPNPNLDVAAVLAFLPFFIIGIFLAATYKIFANLSNLVYFFDLVGAATGTIVVLRLLPLGVVNTILLIGLISSVGSVLLATASKKKKVVCAAIAGLLILVFSTQYFNTNQVLEVQIADNQSKELYDILKDPSLGAKMVESRWNTFGRTDLVELDKYPDIKMIFVDGGAVTYMYRFDGNFSNPKSEVYKLKNSTAYYPYYFSKRDNVLIIGPGGGVDVLIALMAGVNHIAAVEVNPDTVSIVRDYSDFNGGIYTKYGNVHVFVDEGRSFLKRTQEKYDLIMLNIPVTKTSQGTSGYSLAENYLFTTDAFNDYLNHLEHDGYLVIVAHDHLEIHKLVSITLKGVLQGESVQEILQHIAITEERHHPNYPVFILKKSAFTKEEIMEMYKKSDEMGFWPHYFPYINSEELCSHLTYLADEKMALSTLISLSAYDIQPPTDDRPFFYKFEKDLPLTLSQLLAGSLTICIIILFLYLSVRKSRLPLTITKYPWYLRSSGRRFSLFMPYYFSSLGLGFMLIEVSLIQKFILFLGHPTTAISLILFTLLLSSGIGSLYSKRWRRGSLRPAFKASLIVGILVTLYVPILPPLFDLFLSYNPTVRFFISVMLLFPLGFFMGIPFPSGIRALEKTFQEDIPWMWGLNGAYSLLGSILAIAMAMSIGFNATFLFGGVSYLGIFMVGQFKLEMEKGVAEIGKEKT